VLAGKSRCTAHNKARGPCGNLAMKGGAVCRMHGGKAPQVMAKAQQRVAIKELMSRELTDKERRHPWEIVIDAVQRLDQAMTSGTWDNEGAYLEHVVQVIKVGKLIIDAGVSERVVNARTREIEQEARRLNEMFLGVLDHLLVELLPPPADDGRHDGAYADALVAQQQRREAWRRWSLSAAAAALARQPTPPPPVETVDVGPSELSAG
jgi:hypothetical protein